MDNLTPPNETETSSGALKTVGLFFWDLLKIFIIALVIIVPFRMFVAEPFVVSGSSMLPNFHNGDYLVIDRLSYHFGSPERGDVIVLIFPKDQSQFFIKRIIGLPGETVKFSQGHVIIINKEHPEGFTLNESYLPSQVESLARPEPQKLGSDEYFVLGDNRTASSDSRAWGILPKSDIVGKVWLRVYPFSDRAMFSTPVYSQAISTN